MRERLTAMTRTLHHRGPDDSGIYLSSSERVGLVNTRLAIRDLSPAGHMPMRNADGTIWITYNGEIYNADELRSELERAGFAFHSHSDTEVILHGYECWGEKIVERLRGMFAFAIVDERQNRCFIARDHMGVKPLFYAWTDDAFVFASELKGLLAAGLIQREINPTGLVGYLMMGSVPNPLTIYREVSALEPACTMTIDLGRVSSVQPISYWQLPTDTDESIGYDDAVAQVRQALAEAVRIRLVSDVPLGAFLSGGLDSSAVVALMRQATDGPIRTCSMIFEEAEFSEAPFAHAVAESVGAEHFERVVTSDDVVKEIDHIFGAMDQPTVDGVNTYFVSQTARQAGLTVALSGLGGDELFGGYLNTFQGVPQMLRALQWTHAIPGGATLATSAINLFPDHRRWAKIQYALARPASPASAYLTRRGLFSPSEVQSLVSPDVWREAEHHFDPVQHIAERANGSIHPSREAFILHPFGWVSRAELRTYTHHQLLRDTDVMSMAHSLEVREPFLDKRLVETVLRLPDSIKAKYGVGRRQLVVQAVGDLLPPSVRKRQDKHGFTFPFALWLNGPLQAQALARLQTVEQKGWLNATAVQEIFQAYQAGKLHWSRLWALVALGSIV